MSWWKVINVRAGLILVAAGTLTAQQPAPLTLAQAIERSLGNYPAIRVSQEQINAAAAGIQLARTAYLPKVDTLAQVNRGTRNNVFGMLLPQSVIPSMSGPVIGSNNFGTAWGSAMGALVTWEPFDFGLRERQCGAATCGAGGNRKRPQKNAVRRGRSGRRRLPDAGRGAGDRTGRTSGVDRAEVISRTITALVNAQLRPGADASRAEAELAAARTLSIQAQQAVEVARVTCRNSWDLPPAQIAVVRGQACFSCLRSER